MTITEETWVEYIEQLSRLNQTAGQKMAAYLAAHGTADPADLIAYTSALIQKYGEGSAELACQMYDAMAAAAGVSVPPAEPAAVADVRQVAKMVHGTRHSPPLLASGVSRLVKQAGADTTLKNALRDGAEFAWVPHGDTCAFCITLASRGWQRAGKDAIKNGHAQHIHAHCNCEYAVRFDSRTNVAGYDPDKYLQQYEAAGGDINAMRRAQYAKEKDKINAQKRAAYAARMAREKNADGLLNVLTEYQERATPGVGSITYDDGYRESIHREEIETAQWLHDHLGGNIVLLTESGGESEKTPDYLWREKFWELKKPSSVNAADKRLQDGIKQIRDNPGGVILKVPKDIDMEALVRQITSRVNRSSIAEFDIMVVAEDEMVAVFRHKK